MSGMDRVFAFRERDRRLALDPQQTTPSALTCNESSAGIPNPSSRCTLKWWFDKVKGGVERHDSRLNLFSQSPFSFLLHISSFRFIGALFQLLFLRYKGDLVFEISGRRLQFTEMDFALITGLKTGELTIPKNRPTTSTLRDKYFKEYPVLKKHLMDVFERLVDTNKHEDVVKVALLMVVEWFVRGTEPKTMCNMDYIYLVDSLDNFYSYPWGSLAYYTMSQGVEAAVVASSAVRYTVCGCVFPLQIWAVERVPALRECVVSYVPYQIPRFIQYRGWKGWRYNKIHAIFESKATFVVMTLEPTLQEWETDAVRLVRDSFQVIETQEDEEESNENDSKEDDGADENDEKDVEGEGLGGDIMKHVLFMDEFRVEREELKKEREELKKEREEMRKEKEELRKKEERLDEREALLKEKEALKMEREELNERTQLRREKELFLKEKDDLKLRMCEVLREREKLAMEREEFNKEKEDFCTQREHFMREKEDEELKTRGEVDDMEEKEHGHGELEVQSYSTTEAYVLDQASISPPVYRKRTKRVLKPSYYKVSSYLSLSAFDTTPGLVPGPEQATTFATYPIQFPVQMDPFRMLSTQELKELEDWYEANKDTTAGCWFSTIWVKDAWVDSVQCLEACLPILIAYRDSKSASERASLIGEMSTAYAVAKQRDKPYAKAIWCCERVYVPVNHNNSHWFLMVIYPRKREIIIVDSLHTNALLKYKQKIKVMTEALPILFHATGDSTALEGKKWTAKVDESAPKQDNGYDCGIFVMKFIDILCSGLTLAGTDMRKFTAVWRKSIAYDCLSVNCE
ncbi:uncharacterized protein LOC131256580 isoform X2 [Magnolia sinica]|uniref:uncharacterized protein LOC131256580 isoform X2 n=1 Tax=Magnolia sinica TaxID=86752 RepID=UPI00265ABB35|nr:uncharacterized protein LOC131256580 isoform X2 [Magnolia sinica]